MLNKRVNQLIHQSRYIQNDISIEYIYNLTIQCYKSINKLMKKNNKERKDLMNILEIIISYIDQIKLNEKKIYNNIYINDLFLDKILEMINEIKNTALICNNLLQNDIIHNL